MAYITNERALYFQRLVNFVVPLIQKHSDTCFDDLIALWMSKEVSCQYRRWKTNGGCNKPYEEQLNKLFYIWQEDAGKAANVDSFIALLEGKQGTRLILDKIRERFNICNL